MQTGNSNRIEELLGKWYDGTLSPAEGEELLALLQRSDEHQETYEALQKAWMTTEETPVFSPGQKEKLLNNILGRKTRRLVFLRVAIAAAVAGLVIATVLWLQPGNPKQSLASTTETPVAPPADIPAPASNKAVLTLADGRQIVLETAGDGTLATDGGMQVSKLPGGELVYEGKDTEIRYNTLTVPKGSQPVKLALADGSRVTLNVASSLTYPTAFAGGARKVNLTGEAYFEVAHLPGGKTPFLVETGGMQVEVKGTKFNVNAYPDEKDRRTTLLEGAVVIKAGTAEKALLPGEQAIVANTTSTAPSIRVDGRADLEEAMAWVNGRFRFNNADAETVMRQVARWYDVEVKFAARPRLRFGGQIDRASTLRQMFTILETSGLHFSLQGKVVTVLP
ncbi:FecR domain-containing protein [Flavisolibacter sp. BT320]|nr:FecR domain-containing protein [Flavisolibacter longurius]